MAIQETEMYKESAITKNKDLLKKYNSTRKTKYTNVFCHAPFTSMNFQQNGEVLVCCFNRNYIIGKFPEQSLKDIWFGKKANELRKKFNSHQVDTGCYLCVNQFESENFEGLHAKSYDDLATSNNYPENFVLYPKAMEFEISNQCNLECTMCTGYYSSSIRKNREGLPANKFHYGEGFVEQLEEFLPHLEKAKFLGGEPFLIKEYVEIWEHLVHLNPKISVSITTNGTILNERVKSVLEKLNVWVVLSIDSIIEETYTKIRLNANYARVMENLSYFKSYSKRKNKGISFAVCPMTDNWHEMADLTNYCSKNGIHIFFNTVIRPKNKSLMFLNPIALNHVLETLKKEYYSKGLVLKFASKNSKQFKSLIKQIEKWCINYKNDDIAENLEAIAIEGRTIEQLNEYSQLPKSIPVDCYLKIFSLMPKINLIQDLEEQSKPNFFYLLNEVQDEFKTIEEFYGSYIFALAYLHASYQYITLIKKENFDSEPYLLVVNRLETVVSKNKAWDLVAKNLFNSSPTKLTSALLHFSTLDDGAFESTLFKNLTRKRHD